jgi:hypothetical protein
MQLIIETRSGGFSHWAKEAERVVKTLLTLDRFRLLHWSHHQQCPDHHSLAEVDEIHVPKKETAGPEITVRLSAVQNEMERPARRDGPERKSNGDEAAARCGGGGGGSGEVDRPRWASITRRQQL